MVVSSGAEPFAAIDGAMFQLRDKEASAAELAARAPALSGWVVTINVGGEAGMAIDARALGADYLHLPESLPVYGGDLPFGRSVHSPEEAARCRCAYLVAGPVWPTPGKPDAIGLAGLRAIIDAAAGVPVFAIGGITGVDRARRALDVGAYGVAGIRGFTPGLVERFVRLVGD
jgi:thiamine-phosphate pyrophosphorylase